MPRVLGFIGLSGSGKTTLLTALLRALDVPAAVVKHTHHALNEERRGDTERCIQAGAVRALLAREGVAVVFERDTSRRIAYHTPADLIAAADAEVVLVEGFTDEGDWPQILVTNPAQEGRSRAFADPGRIAGVVGAGFAQSFLRRLSGDGVAAVLDILDRMAR